MAAARLCQLALLLALAVDGTRATINMNRRIYKAIPKGGYKSMAEDTAMGTHPTGLTFAQIAVIAKAGQAAEYFFAQSTQNPSLLYVCFTRNKADGADKGLGKLARELIEEEECHFLGLDLLACMEKEKNEHLVRVLWDKTRSSLLNAFEKDSVLVLVVDKAEKASDKEIVSVIMKAIAAKSPPKEGYQPMAETESHPTTPAAPLTFEQIAEKAGQVTEYFSARSPQIPTLLYVCHTRKANSGEKGVEKLPLEIFKTTLPPHHFWDSVEFGGKENNNKLPRLLPRETGSSLIATYVKDSVLVLVVDNPKEAASNEKILSVIKKAMDKAAKNPLKEGYRPMTAETESQPTASGGQTATLLTFEQIAEKAGEVTEYYSAWSPQDPSLLYICYTRTAINAEKEFGELERLASELMKTNMVFEGKLIDSYQKDFVLVLVVENAKEGSEKEILSHIKKAIDEKEERAYREEVEKVEDKLDVALELFAEMVDKKEIDSAHLRVVTEAVGEAKDGVDKLKMIQNWVATENVKKQDVKLKQLGDERVFLARLVYCAETLSAQGGKDGAHSPADVENAMDLLKMAANSLTISPRHAGEFQWILRVLEVEKFVADSTPKWGYQPMAETESQPTTLGENTAALLTFEQIAEKAGKEIGYFSARPSKYSSLLYICHTRKENSTEMGIGELADELMKNQQLDSELKTWAPKGGFREFLASYEKNAVLVVVVMTGIRESKHEIVSAIKEAIDKVEKSKVASPTTA